MEIQRTQRIQSLDLLRGLVMVIMALDHVRDFFNYGTFYNDPTDMETTTPILFFTRWITHFCAPIFVFLAGTAAFMYGQKVNSSKQLSKFLLSRGIWLVFIEVTIVAFAWDFDLTFSVTALQVIWAIGISMIFLAILIHLPDWFGIGISAFMVLGHNLLDGIVVEGSSIQSILWYVFHQQHFLILKEGEKVYFFAYPLIPWLGVMALGYYMGNWFKRDFPREQRIKNLWQGGLALILFFLVFRFFNIYGDAALWEGQRSMVYTFMDFWNTSKYPPSLLYLCMTIGPALLLLAWADSKIFHRDNPFMVFGKVPFFYYVLHFYIIHSMALIIYPLAAGVPASAWIYTSQDFLAGGLSQVGFPLWVTYAVWIFVVTALYLPCRWYANLKARRKDLVFLSYL